MKHTITGTLHILVFTALTIISGQVVRANNPAAVPESQPQNIRKITATDTDAHITGHVTDKNTGEHLAFITISIKGTTLGMATDATGHFFLKNLPVGEHILVASAIGYKTVEIPVTIRPNVTLEEKIEMEEDLIMLDNVVVTANRGETTRREASTVVNVLSPKLFEQTNSVCLAQGLNYQPGVRVENNCQNCGFTQVRINGLEGPYTQILIDGRAIFSSLAGVYGLEQIPANMIDRVEVIRGGGSALYGSNAIAGTINIITKEPLNNSLSIGNTTTLVGGTKPDINTSINAALVSDDTKKGFSFYGNTRQRTPYDANGDGFTEIGVLRGHNLGFRSYFKTSTQSKLTLEYHNTHEFRRGGNKLDQIAHEADIAEQTEHEIHSGNVKFDWFTPDYKHRLSAYASAQNINRNSYYGAKQDLNAYGSTHDFAALGGVQYIYAMERCLFMPANLTAGAEYSYNTLKDVMLGYDRTIEQTVYTYSAFAQNEWKNKHWSILLGLRLDKHNMIDKPIISPRVNLRYSPAEWVILRAGYASGFRAPQAFNEDLHITAVGGEVALIQIADDLQTERSHSVNVSAEFYKTFGKVQTTFLVDGFYTMLDRVFVIEEKGKDANGNLILERRNGAGAVVKGINLETRIVPSIKWNVQAGATLQRSRYTEPETWSQNENIQPQTVMFRSPDAYAYLTANYMPVRPLTLSLSGTYTGKMLVQHYAGYIAQDEEVWTPNFFDINFKAAYDIPIGSGNVLQVNAGVQNILNSYQKDFDIGVERDAGYIYGPSLPRSYFVGVKFEM